MKVTVTYKNALVRRLVKVAAIGAVFLTGLTLGSTSTHSADVKANKCHQIAYTKADYQRDVTRFGQKVADYNEGFATATTDCPK